jgi:phosphatidylserine/phosphatidylglycerophosphate/cardiolipin synthase-like enzyme
LLHNKFGIIDQETVITGSHNWTEAANKGNDETVLVVHSAIVAAHYQREFERLTPMPFSVYRPPFKRRHMLNSGSVR